MKRQFHEWIYVEDGITSVSHRGNFVMEKFRFYLVKNNSSMRRNK